MWRSEARSATAFSSSALTSLTTGRVVDERAAADLGFDVVVVGRVVERALDEIGARVGALDRGEEVAGVGERGEDRLAR